MLTPMVMVGLLVGPFLPFNINSALIHVSMGGHTWGPVYLWFRVPLQLALMSWTYRFAIRSKST